MLAPRQHCLLTGNELVPLLYFQFLFRLVHAPNGHALPGGVVSGFVCTELGKQRHEQGFWRGYERRQWSILTCCLLCSRCK